MKEVSIAMTTFNGERYLEKQLESFTCQTHLPDELVVCDDGSTDRTLLILRQFASHSPFPTRIYENSKNLGYTQNFSRAISHCMGRLVFLSDQDDVWFPNKIDHIVCTMHNHPSCWMVLHDGMLTDAELKPTGHSKMAQFNSVFGKKASMMTGALTAIRREYVNMLLPIPSVIIGHDIWLHEMCKLLGGEKIVLDECLQFIRRHNSNTSQFVANSDQKMRYRDVLIWKLKSAAATSYSDQIARNIAQTDLLMELTKGSLPKNMLCAAARSLSDLKRQRCALIARDDLVKSPAIARRLKAVRMLYRHDYAEFDGLKSFMRDMMR